MALEMRGISKSFPGVKALDSVGLKVADAEIHAVVGENGAGKTTLMNILAGVFPADTGAIFIDGAEVSIPGTLAARRLGIAIIYQHLNMVPDLNVAENIGLGSFSVRWGRIDADRLHRMAADCLGSLDAGISTRARLGDLSVADQQLVAIARAISHNARIIIMDEPTSSLTPKEVGSLFRVVARLRDTGTSIIFISHHMDDILAITDRVTVLRDGRLIGDWNTRDLDETALVTAMAGRPISELFPKTAVEIGKTVMQVRDLSSAGAFADVGFDVRAGEILGIGGLVGAGRSEVLKTIYGERIRTGGTVALDGRVVDINSPRKAVSLGIAFISEDRSHEGLLTSHSVTKNITLPRLSAFTGRFGVDSRRERRESERLAGRLGVKTPSVDVIVRNLSGGNQQKVALAKWFGMTPRVLLLDEPTRGIDVGAKSEIYRLLGELAAQGVAIVMVSSELPELMAISDRILIMCRGRQAGEFSREEATSESLMLAAAGGCKA